MRYLLISDIHANLAAFETVLKDAEGRYDKVWCLGDMVGYGPDPNECVELLLTLDHICLAGNHDWAVLGKLDVGAGLRLRECLKLRVKDVDFGYRQITVRDGKGAKDRVTMLPAGLAEPLRAHRQARRQPHAAPLLRHAASRGRLRHPHGTGAARARRREYDHGVHARP